MAEQPDGQERTEQATPKRLSEAREKGQIPRSRELTTMLLLFASALILSTSSERIFGGLRAMMRNAFMAPRERLFDPSYLYAALVNAMLQALDALTPLLMALVIAAICAPLAIGGWAVDTTAIQPKWERIDPVAGLRRVFGLRGFIEMFKALAKFALILGFTLVVLRQQFTAISALGLAGLQAGMTDAGSIMLRVLIVASAATIVIALIDVPYQIWDHARNLRMSLQEVKDELRESEGSPELRGRIRRLQQELATRRMMEQVPKADVVITNPTHYAVALRFDAERMAAPQVVARGADEIAARIRERAAAAGVTVLSAPPLARALFHSTQLNCAVPAGLYIAVAQVLAYVFHLRRADRDADLPPPQDYPIPDELRY